MTLEELETLIACHGTQRERWPVGAETAVMALVATSPAAARLLDDARALDRVLDNYTVVAPRDVLRARLLAASGARADVVRFPTPIRGAAVFRTLWPQAAALMAASFIGLWIGVNVVSLPLFNEQDLSGYVLGNDGDVIASLEGGQP